MEAETPRNKNQPNRHETMKTTTKPVEMTLAEAYELAFRTRIGGALCCLISGDMTGLAAYGYESADALKAALLEKANIAIVEG